MNPLMTTAAGLAAASLAFTCAPGAASAGGFPKTLRDIRGAVRPALDPEAAALVIVDAQREYAAGPLRLEGLDEAVAEIARLRTWARAHGVPVIHVRQESPEGSTVFAKGGAGAQIVDALAPATGEKVVVKTHPNSFYETNLDSTLHRLGRRQLILTGFMAHMCLDSTARAGFDLGYDVFVVASATAERAIPGPDGRLVGARDLVRHTLAALNDRFAWIVPDAEALGRR